MNEEYITQTEAFCTSVYASYKDMDSEQELTLILDLEVLNGLLKEAFNITYHEVANIQTDGRSVKLTLEKL